MQKRYGLFLVLLLSLTKITQASEPVEFKRQKFSNINFATAKINQSKMLKHYWINPVNNKPFTSIVSLNKALEREKQNLIFAVNSGIFSKEKMPLGWCVEQGVLCQPINLVKPKNSVGNFSLLPNGVFFIEENGKAHVLETDDFMSKKNQFKPYYATQSGPMLVINGKIHPRFIKNSDSLKYRSGVCVKEDAIYFSVNETPINFYRFAEFFKNELKCDNALYLDGTLSQIYYKGRFYGAPFWNVKPYVGIWGLATQLGFQL